MILEDGTVMRGGGFGASASSFGEIVFNTGMVGYAETLTDPSYRGQLLALTYPLVGNYGVPDPGRRDADGISMFFESESIQARGLVVHELSGMASHWNMAMTLDEWMHGEGVPGISGIDTRALTRTLREAGVMMAALVVSDGEIDEEDAARRLEAAPRYADEHLMGAGAGEGGSDAVYGDAGKGTVVVVDAGAKNAILRCVREMGYRAVTVPWDSTAEHIMSHRPDGVVVSNGPGDPLRCGRTVSAVRSLIGMDVPMLGICLGAQIMGLAGGASTYKLKYGHRGQNKPCLNLEDGRVHVTSQNHGYCIDPDSLAGSEFEAWFTNSDDRTVEGIRHRTKRCVAVQFHPEASPGPYDCRFVFERLRKMMAGEGAAA